MATTYHVATDGSGDFTTIAQVNAATLNAGDSVLFRRGDVWRERLIAMAGSSSGRITYSSYGDGELPKLQVSYTKNNLTDWTDLGSNVWSNSPTNANVTGSEIVSNASFDSDKNDWTIVGDGSKVTASWTNTAGEYYPDSGGLKIYCTNSGTSDSNIELQQYPISITAEKFYKLTFYAKSTEEFTINTSISVFNNGTGADLMSSKLNSKPTITTDWTQFTIYLKSKTTLTTGRLRIKMGTYLPTGATVYFDTFSLKLLDNTLLYKDVAALITDNESSIGMKRNTLELLANQDDFYYDPNNWELNVYSVGNPAAVHSDIEIPMYGSNVVAADYNNYSDLWIKYGGYLGIEIQGKTDITIRNIKMSYIGGSHLEPNLTGRTGNGIQISDGASNVLIEKNKLWAIYDVPLAIENMGDSKNHTNIILRNNIAYDFGLCGLEFWSSGTGGAVNGLYYENNTIVNSGGPWINEQRNWTYWNSCLSIYNNHQSITNMHIRNNVFVSTAVLEENGSNYVARALFIGGDYFENLSSVDLNYNLYYRASGELIYDDKGDSGSGPRYTLAQFSNYQSDKGFDSNSIAESPLLRFDYGLTTGSPAINAGVSIPEVTDDFFGVSRPQGAGYDVGAFEWTTGLNLNGVVLDGVVIT